jgi:hypothetical protein
MTSTPAARRVAPTFDIGYPIWRLLTSVRFAVLFIATLALIGLLGVLIPQVPEAMRGNEAAVDAWLDSQRGTSAPSPMSCTASDCSPSSRPAGSRSPLPSSSST